MARIESRTQLDSIAPFFIVSDVTESATFYRDQLGFNIRYMTPDDEPFFAIVSRDRVQVMLKSIDPKVAPLPNSKRHAWAKWDAFIHVSNPDELAEEFSGRGVVFSSELADTEDGLRGFELQDADGYVLFFGQPR